ncbi:MAG: cyclic nucleotide-binding domain-containing protein [Pirellulaceae bacterium]
MFNIANRGGGHDNITAICVRVPEAAKDTRAQEVSLKLEVLRGMPLFKFLTYKQLVHVMNVTQSHSYEADDKIFVEHQSGDKMFVILSGKVRLQTANTTIADLGKGAHFGEMALIDRSPRSLNAISVEPSRLLSIDRKDFYTIVRKEPALSVKLLWSFVQVLAERLRKTTAELS